MSGKIQKQDVKTLAQLTGAGASASDLINDTQIYVSANSINKQLSQAITDGDIGGGAGGAINLIGNPDAEQNTTGWSTYADAAGARPVNGTGGSANITWTRSTSSPLKGAASFLLTKDAANRQGEGVSYDFTVDPIYRAKVLQIEIPMIVVSGTFAAGSSSSDSDVIAYIYDVTNSRLIEPTTFKFFNNSTSVADKLVANFQTSADGATYRLILHVATTSASAFVLKFDEISVSPTTLSYGTPISDWKQDNTSTISRFAGFGTPSSLSYWWRRVGSEMQLRGSANAGTTTASLGEIPLPSSYSIGTTSLASTTRNFLGLLWRGNGPSSQYASTITGPFPIIENTATSTTSVFFTVAPNSSADFGAGTGGSTAFGSGDFMSWEFSVPIAGWSAQVQSSDVNDQRIVALRAYRNAAAANSNSSTPIIFDAVDYDTHFAFNTSTGVFTAPISGVYRFECGIYNGGGSVSPWQLVTTGTTSPGSGTIFVPAAGSGVITNGSVSIQMIAGATAEVRGTSGSDTAYGSGSINTWISISRVANPASITSTETIAARYFLTGSVSFSPTQPIDYSMKDFDTHNAVTTGSSWKFTAPAPGIYELETSIASSVALSNIFVYKNATQNCVLLTAITSAFTNGSTRLKLNAGDYVDIRGGTSESTHASTLQFISIQRIGI